MVRADNRLDSRAAQGLAALLISVLSWPLVGPLPTAGLDPSWMYGEEKLPSLYAAGHLPTSFTYGPLGFLTLPVDFYRVPFVAALVFNALVHTALAFVVLRRVTAALPETRFFVPAFITLVALRLCMFVPEIAVLLAVFGLAELLDRRASKRPFHRPGLALGVAFAAVLLLVKFSSGVAASAVVVIGVLALCTAGPRRRLAYAAGSGIVIVALNLGLYACVTRAPSSYPHFVRDSLDLSSGYDALSSNTQGTLRLAADALVVVLCLAAIGWQFRTSVRLSPGLTAACLIVVYVSFREGFERNDNEHLLYVLPLFLLLPLAHARKGRDGRGMLLVGTLCLLVSGLVGHLGEVKTIREVRASADVLRTTVSQLAGPRTLADNRAAVAAGLNVPPTLVAALRGHRVQVDSYDAVATYGYSLPWDPVADYQLYAAYTPRLDHEDVTSLLAPAGPDRVLRSVPDATIDGRYPLGDAPAYQVAELCNFTTVASAPQWAVLARSANRCGTPQVRSTFSLEPGQSVNLGPTPADSVVVLKLSLTMPLQQKLRKLVAWTDRSYILLNGKKFRLVVATAPDGMVISASPGVFPASDALPFAALTTFSYEGPATAASITVETMAMRPAGGIG